MRNRLTSSYVEFIHEYAARVEYIAGCDRVRIGYSVTRYMYTPVISRSRVNKDPFTNIWIDSYDVFFYYAIYADFNLAFLLVYIL